MERNPTRFFDVGVSLMLKETRVSIPDEFVKILVQASQGLALEHKKEEKVMNATIEPVAAIESSKVKSG